jgi:hypothetical protein
MRYVYLSLAMVAILLPGCGSNTPSPAPEPPKPPAAPPTPPPQQAPKVEEKKEPTEQEKRDAYMREQFKRRPPVEVVKAETVLTATEPEQVVEQLGKAISDHQLQAIWEFLPPKYQTEFMDVIADLNKRVDPGVWTGITTVFQTGVVALKEQKERFFKHPISEHLPISKESLEKGWDPAVAIGEALLDSQLYAPETLKTFDPAAFLATTGGKIVDQLPALAEASGNSELIDNVKLIDSLKTVKASKVSGDENTAVIKIELEGKDPTDVDFVKVDGKWIPKMLEEQWPTLIQQLKDAVAMIPAYDASNPDQKKQIDKLKGTLALANLGVGTLAAAQTDKDFDDRMRFLWKTVVQTDFPVPPPGQEKKEEAPKADAKPAEETKSEESKAEEPKKEESNPEEAKPEEPKKEEPKAEEPNAEEAKPAEPPATPPQN